MVTSWWDYQMPFLNKEKWAMIQSIECWSYGNGPRTTCHRDLSKSIPYNKHISNLATLPLPIISLTGNRDARLPRPTSNTNFPTPSHRHVPKPIPGHTHPIKLWRCGMWDGQSVPELVEGGIGKLDENMENVILMSSSGAKTFCWTIKESYWKPTLTPLQVLSGEGCCLVKVFAEIM